MSLSASKPWEYSPWAAITTPFRRLFGNDPRSNSIRVHVEVRENDDYTVLCILNGCIIKKKSK
jgi:hypothetical protein